MIGQFVVYMLFSRCLSSDS